MPHAEILDLARAGGVVLAFITGAYLIWALRFRRLK